MKHRIVPKTIVLFAAALAVGCRPQMEIKHPNNNFSTVALRSDRQYLLLPVEDGAPDASVTVTAEGHAPRTFRIALARTRTDSRVPFDLSDYSGSEVRIEATNCPYDALCWQQLACKNDFRPGNDPRFRPRYHHAPTWGWMNDPNGMVWYDGEYHLFFQRNPYGSRWENMTWGHSVSRDLLHWEQLSDVLEPDSLGAMFSGCCVVDHDDTAGFGKEALVAIYTAAGQRQTQCLAYSTDRGRTFTKYAGNPVLTSPRPDFRDPKVFRHEPTKRWVMVLAAGQGMEFYSSADLKEWRFESRFGEGYGSHAGIWECPDLFPLDTGNGEQKWVLLCSLGTESGSKVQYFTGDFDGCIFTPDTPCERIRWMDEGRDHYATVTWSNAPDGRRIALGWMNNWQYANHVPTRIFRGINTLPRELSLRRKAGEWRLVTVPVSETERLCGSAREEGPVEVGSEYNPQTIPGKNDGCWRLELEFADITAEVFGFKLFNCNGEYVDCVFNRLDNSFRIDRTRSGEVTFSQLFPATDAAVLAPADNRRIVLYADRCSLEAFIDGGETTLSQQIFPSSSYDRMNIYTKGGKITLRKLRFQPIEL